MIGSLYHNASRFLRSNQQSFCVCSLPLLLQVETLPRPSHEEFVEAGWGATTTIDDITTTSTTTEDITTTITDDITTTNHH
jgi:hypothetical protein